jgi:hypothetical protein
MVVDLQLPTFKIHRIFGVMVSALASSAVDRVFESRSVQTKDYEICIFCFFATYSVPYTSLNTLSVRKSFNMIVISVFES